MKKFIPVLAVLLIAGAACTKNELGLQQPEQQTLETKLAGGSKGDIIPGSILVKLDEGISDQINETGCSDIFEGMDIKVSPAIKVTPKNQAIAEKYGLNNWFEISFDETAKPQEVATRLAGLSEVRTIQYNRFAERIATEGAQPLQFTATKSDAGAAFNDPYLPLQWNLDNDGTIAADAVAGADVGVKDAWRLTGGDPSVVVAVFDGGLAYRHEDLKDAMWTNEAEINGKADIDDDGNGYIDDKYGYNFIDNKGLIRFAGTTGHGTHVAGIIGATNNNGKGVSSIAGGTGNGDGVRLMSIQVFEGQFATNPSDSQMASAYIYAADNGACIAQCSYAHGIFATDAEFIAEKPLEYAAMQYFLDPANSNHTALKGNLAVFSAGNYHESYSRYPGALSDVICVTAISHDFLPAGYSNHGPGCKIAAPGGELRNSGSSTSNIDYSFSIASTGVSNSGYPGVEGSSQYVYMYGTSMACPHVSGVLALGVSYAHKLGKTFSREDMTSMLLTSVNDIDSSGKATKVYYDRDILDNRTVNLNEYYNQMGTGALDAWKFLMAIEGIPSVIVAAGEKASIDLSDYCNPSDTYEISIDSATKSALGLSSDPVIRNGQLELECTKIGAGKITLSSAVGKDTELEGGIGEMEYSREISIVSRKFAAKNGGWL